MKRRSVGSVSDDWGRSIVLRNSVNVQTTAGGFYRSQESRPQKLKSAEGCCWARAQRSLGFARDKAARCRDFVLRLSDADFGAEVNVLDCVQELDAFLHGALERFA